MKRWFKPARKAFVAPSVVPKRAPVTMMTTLEPRIMFDAALAATAAEAAHPDAAQAVPPAEPAHDTEAPAAQAVALPDAPAAASNTVVFVDARVQDAATLLQNMAPDTQVVVLQAGQDGLQQMAEHLAANPTAGSVQIVAHGNEGDLWLGSTYLSADTLGDHAAQLAEIGGSIQQGGDILIYACDTARDAQGLAFVSSIAALTGRDVAASDDRTGARGDWDLEVSVGSIESVPALALSSATQYAHDLAIVTVTNNADSGSGSLRNAISSAASGDTITFNAGMTVTLSSGQLTLSKNLTIDGDLDDNGSADVTIDANYTSRVLSVSSGQTVTLDGLVLTHGLVAGDGGAGGSAAAAAFGAGISNAGTLTLNNVTVTGNSAAGGGGGGGVTAGAYGGGGGGGGARGNGIGGTGGDSGSGGYYGVAGSANTGGPGGGFSNMGGGGGTSSGGAGGTGVGGYTNGGNGGTANNGSVSVGGGGGGSGWNATGGAGGPAVGGVYNASSGTITIIGSSIISNNLGAGGGGGGGAGFGSPSNANGGAGGLGVGGILNNGGTVRMTAANYAAMTGNAGGSGSGGPATGGGSTGISPTASNNIHTLSGTTILNYNPNSAPVIANLSGDGVSHTEGGSATLLDSGSNATVTDSDSADFNSGNVTVSIASNRVSGEDVLAVRNEGTAAGQIGVSGSNITYGGTTIGTFAGGTGTNNLVITLNANSSAAAVQALVRNLTYANTNTTDPSTSTRTVRVTINDGDGGTSSNADVSVSVTGVNDAPTASATGGTPTYTENGSAVDLFSSVSLSTVESGQTITGMTFTASNLANGSGEILRIDGTDIALTHGASGTTTGGNLVDYSVSVAGSTATIALAKASGLSTANAQTVVDGMTYRNASEAPDTTSRVVTLTSLTDSGSTSNGGVDTTTVAIAATVAIGGVNDAPTLSGGPHGLTGTNENTASSGTLVSTLLAALTHADVDTSPSSGIAVTASTGNGTWQYSTDGVTWNGVGSVSTNAALLLSSSSQLRYTPDDANGETATLTFRAWDQTSGTASTNATRNTADTGTNGGTTAFSTGTAQASITVTSVNDAPVLTPAAPALTGINDGDVNNAGQTVASIVGSSITDVDSGAVEGIAITGLASGTGTWQYSLDGTSWSGMGSVAANNALLLRATDHVRFVPDGVTGTTGSISYLAWDQTGATAGQQGTQIDAGSTGGSTPFSAASDTASITVTAVNDAPVVTASGGTTAFTESDGGSSTPVVVDSGITLSDTDNTTLASAAVSITGNLQSGQDALAFANTNATSFGNIAASYNSATGVLTLTSSGATATLAQWQAALRAVTYANSSEEPGTANRTISFVVNDGALDSNAATKTISVDSVNDTPAVTVPVSIAVAEDTASAITGITFSDTDAGSSSVTATLSVGSGSLAASSGGGVTVGGTGSARTLTGTVANINAFIAASNVSFTSAADNTGDVTLTAAISDGANTGTGGAKTDSDTTTLQVAAINDRPGISAPVSIAIAEDVAGALTGISFSDVDAGSASVTATFFTPAGSLVASAGSGVGVSGSGTGTLVLTGSVADINAFIAASGVSFTTAANSSANVVLTVQIDDGGNTGSDPGTSGTGSSEDRATTVTLIVSAVNDAPVNTVPAAQNTDQNVDLVFSTANGNLISVGDLDAGSSSVELTLTATHGELTLRGNNNGLTFTVGDGTRDATMIFTGSLSDVNHALDGLTFTPDVGYTGAASLQVTTDDQGFAGSGGAAADTDTVVITVNTISPEITSVTSTTPDGTYKAGDTVTLTLTFDQAVTVDTSGGSPTLLLETGAVDRSATYASGSGTATLTFQYVVQTGDGSADLDYASTSALSLNGATIRNAGGDDALLTLPTVGGASSIAGQRALVIDAIAPTVTSVSVPADGTYVAGQALDFTVNLSEAVAVNTSGGTPRVAVTLDTGGTVFADYLSGSGTSALVFRLTVGSGQLDSTGIALGSSIDLNGGTLADAVGNDATTALHSVGSTAGVLVDAIVPTVSTVNVPGNGSYGAGDVLSFTLNTSEVITVAGGTPRLALDVGGSTVFADYVSGSGSSALVFQYTVQAGDNDADGIAVSTLQANGATLRDAASNDLTLTLNSVGATTGVAVDTTAPTAAGIARADASPTRAGSFSYIVTFSEDVSGVDAGDFSLVATGSAAGSIASVTAVNAQTYTVLVTGVSGDGTLRLDLHSAATGIADGAGNALAAGLTGQTYTVDRVAPAVTSVSVPADGTYVAGQALDFTVNLNEAVVVDTSVGTPRVAVTLDTGGTVFADYVSGSGTPALVFRLTVGSGQLDSTGIALGSSIELNGGTLADAVGNDATTTLNSVGSTAGVLVDAVAPTVAGITVPADGSYGAGDVLSFTLNTSEAVTVAGGTPHLALDVGGSTVFADYVSGSGSALVFQYTVQAGDNDADGIAVSSLQTNGATLRDATGNDLTLALSGVAATDGVLVDTAAPAATGIARANPSPTRAGSFSYTVTFSEDVSGVDTTDFSLVATGSASGSIASVSAVDARTYAVLVDGASGEGTLRLDLHSAATGISDTVGNALTTGLSGERYELLPLVAAPPAIALPPAEPSPPAVAVPGPSLPPVTLQPMDPISPVLTPTLNPTGGTSSTSSVVAAAANPFSFDAPGAPAMAPLAVAPAESRAGFIEMGAASGAGLRAIPDIGDFGVQAGQAVHIPLPPSTFSHSERNAQVSVEVRMADGRPLPAWLKFDPVTGTLSGQAPRGLNQRLAIEVIARDNKGNRASSHLDVDIKGTPTSRETPAPRPSAEPHSLLIEPDDAHTGLAAAAAALQAHTGHATTGRAGLAEQFACYGEQARFTERAALLEHARAAAGHGA